jgi:hypothetical protein
MILLPNGQISYNRVDTIASTPDGSRLYFVDENTRRDDESRPILAYYDHQTAIVNEIGYILIDGDPEDPVLATDQAAFSPEGTLYIAGSELNKLYTVNHEKDDDDVAVAVEVGTVVNESTDVELNINGADIAFSAEGVLYLWINNGKMGAPAGLYLLTLPAQGGQVMASHLGLGAEDHFFTGIALRANGIGDLVGSTTVNNLHIMDRADASDTVLPLPFYLDGELFETAWGDMSIGPFAEESISSR